MNRKDRLKKVVLAAFGESDIHSKAISQCYEPIQNIMNKITVTRERVETEANDELKLRGLSEDKLPVLIGKISQRYYIRTIEDRWLLKMVAIKAYINFLIINLSQIETVLRKRGYEGKIVKIDPVEKVLTPTLLISMRPIHFMNYTIYPEIDYFSVTMKCKGHRSKTVNVELRANVS